MSKVYQTKAKAIFAENKCMVFVNDTKTKYSNDFISKALDKCQDENLMVVVISYNTDLMSRIRNIAREKDYRTLKFIGKNCKGTAKVQELFEYVANKYLNGNNYYMADNVNFEEETEVMHTEEVMEAVEKAAKEYAVSLLNSISESVVMNIEENSFEEIESIEEYINNEMYWIFNSETVIEGITNHMSEDLEMVVWDMIDNGRISEGYIVGISETYADKIKDDYIEELKKDFVEQSATNVVENNICLTKMYLKAFKKDNEEDFNLYYEVGNIIYNACGDGSDSYVEEWCNRNHNKIEENFAEFVS